MTGLTRWFVRIGLAAVFLAAGVGAAAAQDGDGPAGAPDPARVRCEAMTTVFRAFEMTPAAMRDYLSGGGTIDELAAERGVDLEAVEQQWRVRMGDCADRALEAGAITAEHAAAIHDALDNGRLTPFPRGEGPDGPGPQGVFHPGDWGVQPDETGAPAAGQGQGQQPQAGDPKPAGQGPGQGQANNANRPPREDVFMPGGWGWVDDPDLGNVADGEGADWIGHPYYQGVFHPGGWGCTETPAEGEEIFMPGGWGCADPVPVVPFDSPGDDHVRPDTP